MRFCLVNSSLICIGLLSILGFTVSESHAGLVFRDVNVRLSAVDLGEYDLDVDGNGTTDFTFTNFFSNDPNFVLGFAQTGAPFSSNNGVVVDSQTGDGFPTASRLTIGNLVSSNNTFTSASFDLGNLYSLFPGDPGATGNFGGQTGYLGLRFDGTGGLQYGFALVSVDDLNSATPFDVTIRSVGFETTANQFATITAVPEPSSLLLMGACGLAFSVVERCRKKAALSTLKAARS